MRHYSKPTTWLGICGAAALLLVPGMARAQQWEGVKSEVPEWEVGVDGGYGIGHKVGVSSSTASGQTGFGSGYAVGALFGNNTFRFIGGELRYTYRNDELVVSSGGTKAAMSGQSHALHYDVLIHATPRKSAIRPFVALGGGVKFYRGTGASQAYQPLSNLILLTHTSELKPLLTAGAGVKVRLSDRALFRVDVRDYATPYPGKLITPFNSKANGWIHDIAILIGVSTTF